MNDQLTPAQKAIDQQFRSADRKQMAEDFQTVLGMPEGRRILMAFVGIAGVYKHSNPSDNTIYTAGRRDVGLEFLSDANEYAPEQVLLARQERHNLVAERNRQLTNMKREETQGDRR